VHQTLQVPELGKFYHNYEAAISMTFDDGDNVVSGRILNELFAKYGFKGTLMFTANNVIGTADQWNEILAEGYLDGAIKTRIEPIIEKKNKFGSVDYYENIHRVYAWMENRKAKLERKPK
jgi:peptidoglycan/xylan/chitin deacetylase (PgdA/CDA1 family)